MNWTVALLGDAFRKPRAAEFFLAAKAAGVRVILATDRATWSTLPSALDDSPAFYRSGTVPPEVEAAWEGFDTMRAALQAAGVWEAVEVWTSPGTPRADFFAGPETDLVALAAVLGLRLGDGPGGPATVAPAAPAPG